MNAQCNSCGGFNNIQKCPTCTTLICERCRTNHESGCQQAQDMKKVGLGPTIRQVDVVEVSRPNPVEPANDRIVTDGPVKPSIENPLADFLQETVSGVPTVYALNVETALQQEMKNESVSETVLPQEQNTQGSVDDQGSQEHSEQPAGTGSSDSGNTSGEGNAVGTDSDGASAAVESVVVIEPAVENPVHVVENQVSAPAVVENPGATSSVVAGDGQTEPKTTV